MLSNMDTSSEVIGEKLNKKIPGKTFIQLT